MKNVKTVATVIGGILAFMLIVYIIGAISVGGNWLWRWVAAPIEGEVSKREQVYDGTQQLFDYKFFYNLCNDIQGIENRIDRVRGMEGETAQKTLFGLEGRRDSMIAAYNSKAAQTEASGKFRAQELPYRINASNSTNCGGY